MFSHIQRYRLKLLDFAPIVGSATGEALSLLVNNATALFGDADDQSTPLMMAITADKGRNVRKVRFLL